MDSFKDSVTFWATVLGTLVGFFGVFQDRAWMVAIGSLVTAGSLAAIAYARKQQDRIKSATIEIGGRSLDSLNAANLRRHLNRNLAVQRMENTAIIDGEDLAILCKCSGYCAVEGESVIEFTVDADANIPFAKLKCVGFDLLRDPQRKHPIQPMLVGPDGISKRLVLPLLTPLSSQEPFSVMLRCELPGCLNEGTDYYAATLSLAQRTIPHYSTKLQFLNGLPDWVRVYEYRMPGGVKLLNGLPFRRGERGVREYIDIAENIAADSARIYAFARPHLGAETSRRAA